MSFRINDLQDSSLPLGGDEVVELEQGGSSRRVRVADLMSAAGGGSDPANFGIGGQKISTEVDLNSYLVGGRYITPATGLLNLPTGWNSERYVIDVAGGFAYAAQKITNPTTGLSAERAWNGVTFGTWRVSQSQGFSTYATAALSGGVVTLDPRIAAVFGVAMSQNMTLALSATGILGGVAGRIVSVDAIFSQDSVGGRVLSLPSSVKIPAGVNPLVANGAGEVTLVRFSTVDGGTTWLADRQAVFTSGASSNLPVLAGENSTFNDEGVATTGWTATNATMSVASSYLRQTKVAAGSNATISKALTFTPTNADFILYGKVRAKNAADTSGVIWLLNGSKEISIWFGSATANSSVTAGAISMCGTTGASTRNVAVVATGVDYQNTAVDFALQYDHKFSTLTCWFREADGRWKWKARVACNWFSAATVDVLLATASSAGSWIEFDHLTLCKPNIAVIGDSIGEGKTLFSPDPALALTNDESTWMRHAKLYPAIRNNLIVNKCVGGNTSGLIYGRIADVTGTGAQLVFIHASSNDEAFGTSQADRTLNIQNTINAISASGQKAVLLNGSHGTQAGSDNTPTPDLRDYMQTWWANGKNTLTGLSGIIDTVQPVKDVNGFLAASMAADGIHLNATGHAATGQFIAL